MTGHTKEQIDHMVSRFLSWKLPDDFRPDGGIAFKAHIYSPTGTNLFTFTQAREMVLNMLTGLPEDEGEPDRELTAQEIAMIDAAWETHKAAAPPANPLATIPDPEAYMKAARGMREALARLEYWFDTDPEILAAMSADERAGNDRQLTNIRTALRAFDAAQGEQ